MSEAVVVHFDQALEEIESERQRLAGLEDEIRILRSKAAGNGATSKRGPARRSSRREPKAAQHHIDAISDLLANRDEPMRQADIVKALKINGGTVSVALRQLEAQKPPLVKRQSGRDHRSLVWEWIGQVPQEAPQEAQTVTS